MSGALQRSFGAAELSLGLVDGGDDVLAVGAEVRLGEAGHPLAVAADGVGQAASSAAVDDGSGTLIPPR